MAKKKTAGRILAIALVFGPAFLLVVMGSRGCAHKFEELPDYGEAVEYTFTDTKGKERTSKEFEDNIVLVTTLQLTCPDDCAISSFHLDQLVYQQLVRKAKKKQVKIISFVTDGEGNQVEDVSDVEQMLKDRVEGFDSELWIVASGNPQDLYDFERNGESILQTGDEYYGGHAFQEVMLLLDRENHLRMAQPGKLEGTIRRMRDNIALLQKQYDVEEHAAKHKKK